jgi:hypothetical protein
MAPRNNPQTQTAIPRRRSLQEIEAAIEKLPPADYRQLLAWIEEHQAMLGASEALFATYDEEEKAHAQGQTR